MDLISRQAAIDAILHNQEVYSNNFGNDPIDKYTIAIIDNDAQTIAQLPSEDAIEVVRCKDCKHWRRQTNYAGAQLSFGFCESDDMWRSLYGETYEVSRIDTDDDFYCGYAERREDG